MTFYYPELFKEKPNLFSSLPFPFFQSPFASHGEFSNMTIYEHKNSIIVEAPVPGMNADDVKVRYDRGILSIQASRKEEKSNAEKKFLQKSTSSFEYHLTIPGNIDEKAMPQAEVANGLVKITFTKSKTSQGPTTIAVTGQTAKSLQKPMVSMGGQQKQKKKK